MSQPAFKGKSKEVNEPIHVRHHAEDPDNDLLEGFALLFLIKSDPEPLPTSEPTLVEPEFSTTMEPVPEPSSEPSPEPVPRPEPDPPQLEPVIEPSTEHELDPGKDIY